jgi:hypothetical protein
LLRSCYSIVTNVTKVDQSDQDQCCSLSVSIIVIGFVSEQHGSMLVANALCWICHSVAHISISCKEVSHFVEDQIDKKKYEIIHDVEKII